LSQEKKAEAEKDVKLLVNVLRKTRQKKEGSTGKPPG